jgi:hypothetical protein
MAFGKTARFLDTGITPFIPYNCVPATITGTGQQSIIIFVAAEYPDYSCVIPYIHASVSSTAVLTVSYGPTIVYREDIIADVPFIADFGMGFLSGPPHLSKGHDVTVVLNGSGSNKLNVLYALVESFESLYSITSIVGGNVRYLSETVSTSDSVVAS